VVLLFHLAEVRARSVKNSFRRELSGKSFGQRFDIMNQALPQNQVLTLERQGHKKKLRAKRSSKFQSKGLEALKH